MQFYGRERKNECPLLPALKLAANSKKIFDHPVSLFLQFQDFKINLMNFGAAMDSINFDDPRVVLGASAVAGLVSSHF